ncbi:MAG: hypothetical protein GY814_17130, partial [Gammaproteobacteria bacterium]|nr:hypothetical protein [Gammaproteobacteria bacterium]
VAPYTYLFNRWTVAPAGLLVGFYFYKRKSLMHWPFGWIDLPMLTFILMPLISLAGNGFENIGNGLTKAGWYIGFYGFGYFICRLTFQGKEDLQLLTKAVVIFGVVYALPGLYESFVGPDNYIAVKLLGAKPPVNAYRLGGYRPSVFTDGVTNSFLYACMAFAAFWMLMHANSYKIKRLRMAPAATFLLGCEIWFRGISGYLSTSIGAVCLIATRRRATVVTLLVVLLLATSYMGLRASGHLDSD